MLNKVQLIGRLGQDPKTKNGGAVSFTLATSEVWKDRNGEKQGKTEWHNLVAFGSVGELCAQYLKKGSLCYLEGKIQTTRWTPANGGEERQVTQIIVNGVKFLPSGSAAVPHGSQQTPQNLFDSVDTDVPF
jgi:single-strand DNA-binding protein